MIEHLRSSRSKQILLYLIASLLLIVSGSSTAKWLALDVNQPLELWWAYPTFGAALLLIVSAFMALYRPIWAVKLALVTAGLGCAFYGFCLCLAFFEASLFIFVLPGVYVMIWLPLVLLSLTLIYSRRVIKSAR